MTIYPAVDIKDGKCVRLRQGAADDSVVYFENPVDAAKSFVDAGSKHIHLVDLDGAFAGKMRNLNAIEKIAGLGMFVELGGGMRDRESVVAAFEAGVDRAIVGTRACCEPEFARELAAEFGGKIAAGIDARDGRAAVRGWVDVLDVSAEELAEKLADCGVETFIYTDISTDGMLSGANIAAQRAMLKVLSARGAKLIASGGVASEADIEALKSLSLEFPNLEGAVVGKAIYERRVDLASIIRLAAR